MLSAIGCGLVLKLVKQPPLVGYILAGLFIGPSGMGLIDYSAEISSLAELGIILLLFIIGMELSVKAFLTVVQPAVIATMAQILCSILLAAVSHTNLRKPILEATHPLQSLLIVIFFVSIGLLVDLNYVTTHWGVILLVTVTVLCLKTILGWVLLYAGGEPAGRALVSSLITPQIGQFSFVLTTTGVASGIFVSQEADFLLAVIATSLFVSPFWTTVLHYLVVRSKIHLAGEPPAATNLPTQG